MKTEQATWTGSATEGYTHSNGATLRKVGKRWELTFNGRTVILPKRATFDHAEKIMMLEVK